ncbi:MAG: thiamine-phosphate kinase [Planctomycetaceae bacterium]|jgi:thiamine-monophosphate kinase|nr:thiamine-phosphate kinase [Planctomycetaceae bacterium]
MEAGWIKYLRSLPNTELLGDDAAVIGSSLITVDMLTEGVDFILAETSPLLIGRKALAVNLSDIAAMGGIPRWIFTAVALPAGSLVLPQDMITPDTFAPDILAKAIFAGMQPLIDKYGLILAGGDTNTWDGGLVISVTVIGEVSPFGIFRRSGCQPRDKIIVTGQLGGSILGHQFLFEPRISEALYLNRHSAVHAAMDISDGLTLDLSRMLTESGRLGATLYETQIPVSSDAVKLSLQTGRSPLEHSLSDGEDFELLLSVEPNEAVRLLTQQPLMPQYGVRLYEIGEITAESGMRLRRADASLQSIEPKGFEH